ncbi:dipeptidyl-peptidase-like protein V precursor [Xylariaceae sp. FL0594]|nr:dipeptidyl-peptidase-like protein V precursor [Xylariaceae sp. FL0594]
MAFKRTFLFAVSILLSFCHAFDTEGMLAAPRRSTAVVNRNGQILDVDTGKIKPAPFNSSVSEVVWLDGKPTSILYINTTNPDIPGGVTLYTADLGDKTFSPTLVASLDAPFQGLKAVTTKSGNVNFIVNCLASWENGKAYNPQLATPAKSAGLVYDANYIRQWDDYVRPERYAIFSGKLSLKKNCGGGGKSAFDYPTNQYPIQGGSTPPKPCPPFKGQLKNLLWGIQAPVTRPESPVQPFGDQGDYDISPDGVTVAFLTKAPELPKANYTSSYIYIVPQDGSKVAVRVNGPGSTAPKSAKGASACPRWSPDGKKLAYLQQDGENYRADRSKIYIAEINGLSSKVSGLANSWDSAPSTLQWTHDGRSLWLTSEMHASNRLWSVLVNPRDAFVPTNFTGPDSSVDDFAILPNGQALVSAQASWSSRIFYTQAPGKAKKVLFSANAVDPELKGLGPKDVFSFWVKNDQGDNLQTFLFYPGSFNPKNKYPLAFIIHGGPQSSRGDVWSTRWNLRLWAEKGFVVAATQFTGTPGYGQAFTNKIQNNWGGTPYTDLVKVFEYLRDYVPYVDTNRAVAGGAGFGCYMTNWIQGQPLGRKFKALFCHDGRADTLGAYSTDDLSFVEHSFNGTLWERPENFEQWSPLQNAANFSTPELIIHSDGNFRGASTEGIQMFNILQSRGVPSRFLHFPDESHWVEDRRNSLLWHSTIFNWIRYWVGIDPQLNQENVVHQ